MTHITGKLTNPEDYRPKEVIEREKIEKEKQQRQKIREELLAPEPITEMDTKIYSDSLADRSG
jgi:hypothetical protein